MPPVEALKTQTNLLPVPNSQLLIKCKSREHKAAVKAREVLTQDKHPFRRLGKLMSRCLSLLWKEAIGVLGAKEIVAMSDILRPIRHWLSNLTDPPPEMEYCWVEFDIRETFPEIQREDVLPALCWVHGQILQRKTTRGALRFLSPRMAHEN